MLRKEDFIENKEVSDLVRKVCEIDADYVNTESDVIAKKQPFIISLLLGYQIDLQEDQLDDILRVLLLIWEFFKDKKQYSGKQIQAALFDRIQNRNAEMLKYMDGAESREEQTFITRSDLYNLKSKALFSGVMFLFDHLQSLARMSMYEKGIILVGMKSLIECFEFEMR